MNVIADDALKKPFNQKRWHMRSIAALRLNAFVPVVLGCNCKVRNSPAYQI